MYKWKDKWTDRHSDLKYYRSSKVKFGMTCRLKCKPINLICKSEFLKGRATEYIFSDFAQNLEICIGKLFFF